MLPSLCAADVLLDCSRSVCEGGGGGGAGRWRGPTTSVVTARVETFVIGAGLPAACN